MCKCCQNCLETCYWHLIEKRFCYDESIALYEEPLKEEKNNNMFDNMAFYDSVAVIAGRAVVTIEPLPETLPVPVITTQPQPDIIKKLHWQEEGMAGLRQGFFSRSVPIIYESTILEENEKTKSEEMLNSNESIYVSTSVSEEHLLKTEKQEVTDAVDGKNSVNPVIADPSKLLQANTRSTHLLEPEKQLRKKSLRERRMSKSLYLKIDGHKELPIIRQNSMPKFYLDTPQPHQAETSIFRSPSTALASPVRPNSVGFVYDLHSVVQMELERTKNMINVVPVHREADRSSKLLQIRDKIKLRRVKSSISATSFSQSHHM